MTNYHQESKNKVRELMLKSAITALTKKRHSSELIDRKKLRITLASQQRKTKKTKTLRHANT